jgi:hypothetical protein
MEKLEHPRSWPCMSGDDTGVAPPYLIKRSLTEFTMSVSWLIGLIGRRQSQSV